MSYVGFNKLRPGRIHIFCPRCGRKQSNMPRDEETDPKTAVLAHVFCERCSAGCKDVPVYYFNAKGKRVRGAWDGAA